LSETKLPKPRGNLWHVASALQAVPSRTDSSVFRGKCGRFRASTVRSGRVISARLRVLSGVNAVP
jgi:hypothetical protein